MANTAESYPLEETNYVAQLDKEDASQEIRSEHTDNKLISNNDDERKISSEGDGQETPGREPVIQTGKDVSAFVVSLRDDGDPPLTLRGFLVGTGVMVINCAVTQVYTAKPVSLQFSNVSIILLTWAVLLIWRAIMPRESWVENVDSLKFLRPMFQYLNPGPIRIKEHVVATIIASSGLNGEVGPGVLATIKLFYGSAITPVMAIFGLFSISMIGVGFVGLLRPLLIYPSEMVYWYTLPMIAVFQMLHQEKAEEKRRIKIFCYLFAGTCLWEPIVAYVAPWLNGISIPCLASMGAPMRVRKHISRFFGGASANQGLGLFSISLDPQYVTPSTFAGFPLKWQSSYWLGTIIGCFFIIGLFYANAFEAKSFPFMSSALFLANGTVYPTDEVFIGANIEMDQGKYDMYGAPRLTASALWSFFCQAAAIGALITHVAIFWAKDLVGFVQETRTGNEHDPHYQAMKRYKEVPQWWYLTCLISAVVAAYVTVGCSNTTLPMWGLTIALLCGMVIAPFSAVIYASYGSAVATNSISKMVAGGIHGGRPVANLWFSVWCHQIVNLLVSLSDYLKLAQYLKIPWRVMFLVQVYGTLLGAYFNWWVISIIIENKREILLDPVGNNQWSGAYYQSLNAQAVEWALAKYVFAFGSGLHYEIVPLGLLIGALIPPIHWVAKRYISYVRELGDLITTPLFIYYLQGLSGGINSYVFSTILLGCYMQLYLRVYRPRVFREYCYLLSAAVDGAAQIVGFLLSFFVFGGTGTPHYFPVWFGNPDGSPDHCVSTKTYD